MTTPPATPATAPKPAAEETTPQRPPSAPQQPGAPLKAARAWASFVGGMQTMPAEQARRLDPKDIGVHVGPVMDEAQFEAYRKARGGSVRVLRP